MCKVFMFFHIVGCSAITTAVSAVDFLVAVGRHLLVEGRKRNGRIDDASKPARGRWEKRRGGGKQRKVRKEDSK